MSQSVPSALLRFLPRVDDLVAALETGSAQSRPRLTALARRALDECRRDLLDGTLTLNADDVVILRDMVLSRTRVMIDAEAAPTPRRILNATGIIVHTGLGRSLLSRAANEAVMRVAASHCALEVDIESGERGRRDSAVAALLHEITGCEDATVCNNGASAALLALNTLAQGKDVICARGELVEIGGGFRMPDVMRQSGATLREVGCTNKTRIEDYDGAIGEATGALLKVHTSNYRIMGFTAEASLGELVRLGRERGVPVMEDLGSGALVDLTPFGLTGEPRVQESVAAGADVISFSGDKLLGGPQCGLLCGRRETIERIRANPLMRALRVDKMTLAALEATLRHYREPEEAWHEIPTLAAIAAPAATIKARAQRLKRAIGAVPAQLQIVPSQAQAGAGSLPTQTLPSFALAISPSDIALDEFARRLRLADPGVWGRIHDGALWLDCRTLRDEELKECAASVRRVLNQAHEASDD